MIKLLIFDMDGVIAELKQVHFDSLNNALRNVDEKYVITMDEHISIYDGRPTNAKLKILTEHKGLPPETYDQVWKDKQEETIKIIRDTIQPDQDLVDTFWRLKQKGYQIYVASNSIRETIKFFLLRSDLMEYVDHFLSNEEVKNPKPHPEMYMRAMMMAGVGPDETLILEDSTKGRESAQRSGAYLFPVEKISDVRDEAIISKIEKIERRNKMNKSQKWHSHRLNVVVPMAGAGSRFHAAGYTFPKPMIIVKDNKPMIQVVVESLNVEADYTFIVQKKHNEKYKIASMLNMMIPGCNVVETDGLTDGAACTVLLAKDIINSDKQLLIANSDQYIEWNAAEFFYTMVEQNYDGGILTFKANHTKWSYVSVNDQGYVTRIAEKEVISPHATVGIYYWAQGSDFVKYAEQMIAAEKRINNEFYTAPVYNEAIADGRKFTIWDVDKMMGLGTPEDLQIFQREYDPA